MKKKISKIVKNLETTKVFNLNHPNIFFNQIGIKALVKLGEKGSFENLKKHLVRKIGADNLEKLLDLSQERVSGFGAYFSDLRIAKIWYGDDFSSLCEIASELKEISVPNNSMVLDVGGGPGPLAFWMANIWNANVTVADINSTAGPQWAKEIGESRVSFVQSGLPDLERLGDRKFDVIVLSRVLNNMGNWMLPGLRTDRNATATESIDSELEAIGNRIVQLLAPNGQVILIDSWSSQRVLIVGRAFERAGLFVDLARFDAARVHGNYSLMIFSRSIEDPLVNDPVYSLSTVDGFHERMTFNGNAAKSMRTLFDQGEIKEEINFIAKTKETEEHIEILEKEGLILVYQTNSNDRNLAFLYPGCLIIQAKSKALELREFFENNEVPED